MNRVVSAALIALLGAGSAGRACAQAPVTEYQAGPCPTAPRIDGVDSPGEWDTASRSESDLRMGTAKGQTRAVRRAELRLMSSSANLYVALRVPDPARDMTVSPLVADVALLAFCRGDELAAGDDRRVVLPGLSADKHVVRPGQDADDGQRDGKAAMRWRPTAAGGGEYLIEWQVPLASGDPNDISATPGQRLRFNLVYADRFSADLADTEIGGLFGADADHAQGWGTIVLASQATPEAPAPAPAWLARLFEHTGKPDRLLHRCRRLEADDLAVGDRLAGSVIVELAYPGLDGRDELGQARIFLPPEVRDDPARRVPLIHVAGYELDEGGAAALLAKGYAVSTPHAHPLNPLGRGANLDQAILHAARRLACVDPLRVSIQGGSAGGWTTLMLAADAFPLVWAMPDVPPVHWGYNADYIARHQAMAGPAPGSDKPRLPVVRVVGGIAEQARVLCGMPWESLTYLAMSPLAHTATVTVPTQVTFSTADLLVPVDQVSPDLVQPPDVARFPAGFSTAMAERFPGIDGQRTLLGVLPAAQRELFRVPLPAGVEPSRLRADGSPQGEARPLVLPFSKDRPWSIVVIDEGPVEPEVGHFKYHWAVDHEPFRQWAEQRGVVAGQLTAPKLERLMMRLRGKPWRPFQVRPQGRDAEVPGNALDYPEAERADVLLGLTAFAADDTCAARLGALYGGLAADLRALGDTLGDGTATGVRAALAAATAGP